MPQIPSRERPFIDRLLEAIRAVLGEVVPRDRTVEWTELRWDAIDVSAAWSQGTSQRNLHGWVTGDWPIFSLRFEGAAWEDDEEALRRRVTFFSGPATILRVVEGGSTKSAKIEITNRDVLMKDVQRLVEQLHEVELTDVPWDQRLAPWPHGSFRSET